MFDMQEGQEPEVITSITINGEIQKRILRGNRILGIIYTVLGALWLATVLMVFIVNTIEAIWADELYEGDSRFGFGFFLGLIFLILGIAILISVRKSAEQAEKLQYEQKFRFRTGHVDIMMIRRGETVGKFKLYYVDAVRIRETKEFILIYQTAASVYPVDKKKLTPEELRQLRAFLNLPPKM